MPYANEHAARLRRPSDFLRIVELWASKGIRALGGPLKSKPQGGTVEQAIRFKADQWSVAEARKWLKEHDYKPIMFEPATGDKEESSAGKLLECRAIVDIEAVPAEEGKAEKLPTFSIIAYTGGVIEPSGWYGPVVIDLGGLEAPTPFAALKDHDPGKIVGHTEEVEKSARRLKLSGTISGSGEAAREVVENAKRGFPWQASVGLRVKSAEYVQGGATAQANGQSFKGPVSIVRKSILREVSFCAVGADDGATASIAARAAQIGDDAMKFEEWLKARGWKIEDLSEEQQKTLRASYEAEIKAQAAADAPPAEGADDLEGDEDLDVKAQAKAFVAEVVASIRKETAQEKARIAAIAKLCEGHPDIEAKAIGEGWSETKAELEMLRASRPAAPAIHAASDETGPKVIEAALCLGNGLSQESIVKAYGEPILATARKRFGGPIGAGQFVLECAWANGFTERHIHTGNLKAALRAAFSTQAASGILSNVANKVLLDAFMHVEQAWRQIARIRPVNDFKAVTHYRLTGDMEYEEVGPGGELKHGATNEESFEVQAKTYGKMFAVTRQDIINDDLGAFDSLRQMLGRGAGLKLNNVFWTAFLNNGSFFTGGRGNYISGAATVLDSAGLTTGVTAFRKMKDSDGKLLGLTPRKLLVPPDIEADADELYVARNINTGGASTKAKVPDSNIHAGKYQPVVSAYLSDTGYSGYSLTAWYLLADPADLAVIEVVFLNGQETPTVESADVDFDTLGIQVRGYHDFGVSLADYYAGMKSKGAA